MKERSDQEYRPEGRHITAKDVADRLMPDLDMNEVLLWPPDLFAYTSNIMAITSAYQLVVSPPRKENWPPDISKMKVWLIDKADKNIQDWLSVVCQIWDISFPEDDKVKIIKDLNELDFNKIWKEIVGDVGKDWTAKLDGSDKNTSKIFDLIDDKIDEKKTLTKSQIALLQTKRQKKLLPIILRNTPPLLMALWAFFYNEVMKEDYPNTTIDILDLLCNQGRFNEETTDCKKHRSRLWKISQALLTMHAISDIAGDSFGITAKISNTQRANKFAEKLLFGKGSLSTIRPERCRVLPKRHNPSIGIALRSLSSNLAFNQSAVDVVWRKTKGNVLGDRLKLKEENKSSTKDTNGKAIEATNGKVKGKGLDTSFSMLLFPYPYTIRTRDFKVDKNKVVTMDSKYGFFDYESYGGKGLEEEVKKTNRENAMDKAVELIRMANLELPKNHSVDMILFPETALTLDQFKHLENKLVEKSMSVHKNNGSDTDQKYSGYPPSILLAGVKELKKELAADSRTTGDKEDEFNFPRNAIYCKYFNRLDGNGRVGNQSSLMKTGYYNGPEARTKKTTPKYKQYKHHRWQLNESQIRNYGLSGVLDSKKTWWESIKIPKRRVSFLNVGDKITISYLICEDLARQDPIAELIRHAGPSLVVTILMDGPQLKTRWSARYASVLSDDPGCSVIALTSLGMVKKHSSEFNPLSRVVALWSQSGISRPREIELAQGARAILLTFNLDPEQEKTADGRTEEEATSIIRLVDVIQIYPEVTSSKGKGKEVPSHEESAEED
jgi:hypothetical protein